MSTTPSRTIGKAIATGGLVLTACAVCCAPLIIPPVAAFFGAGGIGLALAGQIGLGTAALAAMGSYLYLRRRAASRNARGCGCGSTGGCAEAGTSLQIQHTRKG